MAAVGIGLAPLWGEVLEGVRGGDWQTRFDNLNRFYNPLAGDRASLVRGYGSIVGGIVFKIAMSELVKRAKIKSLMPSI